MDEAAKDEDEEAIEGDERIVGTSRVLGEITTCEDKVEQD